MSKERRHLRFLITSALLVGPALGCGGPEPEPSTVDQPTGNPVGPELEEETGGTGEAQAPLGTPQEEEEPPTGNPGGPEEERDPDPDPEPPVPTDSVSDQLVNGPSVNVMPANHPVAAPGETTTPVATPPPRPIEARPRVNTRSPARVPRPAPIADPTGNPGEPQPEPVRATPDPTPER